MAYGEELCEDLLHLGQNEALDLSQRRRLGAFLLRAYLLGDALVRLGVLGVLFRLRLQVGPVATVRVRVSHDVTAPPPLMQGLIS